MEILRGIMCYRLIMALICLTVCFAVTALAADKSVSKAKVKTDKCYRVIVGQDTKMCRLYEQNLNRFCNEPPMVCDRKIHPDFAKYFSFPKWEDVDPVKHLDIIEKFIKFRTGNNVRCPKGDGQCQAKWREKEWQEYKVKFFDRMKKGIVKLSRAQFNIKGVGKGSQIVFKLVDFMCAIDDEFWNHPMIPQNIVINEKTGELDLNAMALTGYGAPKEVFFYEGVARLSTWDIYPDRVLIDQDLFEQCEIEYIGNKGGKAK
jgi:hypothetical protein